ncbi:hypothetical protein OSTOST_23169, partial [Ostertagia ostertagi]
RVEKTSAPVNDQATQCSVALYLPTQSNIFCQRSKVSEDSRRDQMLFVFALVAGTTAFNILHLADFHLDVDYSVFGDNENMCHNTTNATEDRLGPFGDYMCDSP